MTAVQFRNTDVRLSESLRATGRAINGHRVTLRELLEIVGEQGLLVFCAILGMPFMLPVTIPFMSTALGTPMLLIGIAVMVGGFVLRFSGARRLITCRPSSSSARRWPWRPRR